MDGAGAPPAVVDIGIDKGLIAAVGTLSGAKAATEVNALGKYVAPGFVDITNHSDTYLTLFKYPHLESMVMQGVTTIVGGNCGASLAPLVSREAIRSVSKWADISEIGIDWTGMGEFLAAAERMRLGVNFATLVGFGTLRRGVAKDALRALSGEEKAQIRLLLERALQEGALGMSLGLAYGHERLSATDELMDVVLPLAQYGGVLKIHLRNEGVGILGAINEAVRISREAAVPVIISHFKIIGRASWPNAKKALDLIAYARADGVNISYDVSPYRSTGSPLYLLIPPWARRGGFAELFGRLNSQIDRKRIVEALERRTLHHDTIRIIAAKHTEIVGKSVAEIARAMGIRPEEAMLDIILGNEGRVAIVGRTVSGKNTMEAMRDPASLIASDGYGLSQDAIRTGMLTHPRSFGAFAHFWHRMVTDLALLKPEEAIAKMTGGPAAAMGMRGRGVIAKGNAADIVVFDPRLFRDRATYKNPFRYPAGMEWVLINGKVAVEEGRLTDARAGMVIRKA